MGIIEELKAFQPRFPFFVGIDYDGTIFDTMTVKHREVFVPVFMDTWNVGSFSKEFFQIWESINLYSKDRGINRFAGLLRCFEEMAVITEMPDFSSLKGFVSSGLPPSNAALKQYAQQYPSEFLAQTLKWSERSDLLFQELIEGKPPFGYAKEVIGQMSGKADIMVISSASSAGIAKDLTKNGLSEFISIAVGQDAGGKAEQLQYGAAGKYYPQNILMIGDAPGDKAAVKTVGGLFYPIIPKREEESWKELRDEAFDKFLNGDYAGSYEDSLTEKFDALLS